MVISPTVEFPPGIPLTLGTIPGSVFEAVDESSLMIDPNPGWDCRSAESRLSWTTKLTPKLAEFRRVPRHVAGPVNPAGRQPH